MGEAGVVTAYFLRRSPDWALQQIADFALQDIIGLQPDRVSHVLGFENSYISGLAKAASPRK
jgi:hypothetical protein